MSQTFSYNPEFGTNATVKPNVTQVKYGDGYEQRFASGMNSIAEIWNVSFVNRESADGLAIIAFLTARGGVERFNWTSPEGTVGVWVCREWNKVPKKGNRWDISASFEQVFEP